MELGRAMDEESAARAQRHIHAALTLIVAALERSPARRRAQHCVIIDHLLDALRSLDAFAGEDKDAPRAH